MPLSIDPALFDQRTGGTPTSHDRECRVNAMSGGLAEVVRLQNFPNSREFS